MALVTLRATKASAANRHVEHPNDRLTAKGRRALAHFSTEWRRFRDAVETLIYAERRGM